MMKMNTKTSNEKAFRRLIFEVGCVAIKNRKGNVQKADNLWG